MRDECPADGPGVCGWNRRAGVTVLESIDDGYPKSHCVERVTGPPKDTSRAKGTARRLSSPSRAGNGERANTADHPNTLPVIPRLTDSVRRPGAIAAEPLGALPARVKALSAAALRGAGESRAPAEALRLVKTHQVTELHRLLADALAQRGLKRLVLEVVVPLNALVGGAWMKGELQVFEEHIYTERLQVLLRQAIGSLPPGGQGPRILLTTLPGERHVLGLLMAEACLAVEGAECLSLGAETPTWDIVRAAREIQVDVVGLSFSRAMSAKTARDGVVDLRKRLDGTIELWAGGNRWQSTRMPLAGVALFASLTAIPEALQAWRAHHAVN